MEIHRNTESSLKFVCKICNAQYGRSFALSDHLKSAHPGMVNESADGESEEFFIVEESEVPNQSEVYSVVMVSK